MFFLVIRLESRNGVQHEVEAEFDEKKENYTFTEAPGNDLTADSNDEFQEQEKKKVASNSKSRRNSRRRERKV